VPVNTNAWNRLRYTFWAPVYDILGRGLDRQRRLSLALLDLRPGERLLLVGAGTGAELPHVPPGVAVLATDLTPAMLRRARGKAGPGSLLAVMDGHALALGDAAFDAAALHLVLAVIPDPARCLRETARVVRPGGRVCVFDKFVPDGEAPSALRRLGNLFTSPLFTDITRSLGAILAAAGPSFRVERDEPALLGRTYRRVLLRRPANGAPGGPAA